MQNNNRLVKHLLIDEEDKILFVLYVGYNDNTRKNTSEEKPKLDEVIFWK